MVHAEISFNIASFALKGILVLTVAHNPCAQLGFRSKQIQSKHRWSFVTFLSFVGAPDRVIVSGRYFLFYNTIETIRILIGC